MINTLLRLRMFLALMLASLVKTRLNGLYGEAPPERGTFSGWRYIKG